MKQLIQDLKKGDTILEDVPTPKVTADTILIKTSRSLVSLGTEKTLVEFGKASFIQKAKQQPDKVKMVLDKMRMDGVLPTLEAVFNKLNQPIPLGYCNVGTVVDIGENINGFKIGDRVASNGNHAEYVCVPKNLVAKIPDNVSDDEATFTIIGSIGLQGIRLCNPTFGENIVVIGLGLVGLITAELLKSNGCNVIAYDFDQKKVDIASKKGILAFNCSNIDPIQFVSQRTNSIGADGVIITASAKSDTIMHEAAQMSRKNGRIILIGVVELDLIRSDFYEKELTFQVSCSYGPGRYDEDYEEKGKDYPVGYVRWTEKRNFETILESMSKGLLDVKSLITDKVSINKYEKIYDNINKESSIASIFKYSEHPKINSTIRLFNESYDKSKGIFGIIGAGNFTSSIIIPSMLKASASLKYIASNKGLSAKILAKKGKIGNATSNYKKILDDSEVDAVIISTRHNLHASMIIDALNAQKHVFVEKPLCLNNEELNKIIEKQNNSRRMVVVGFNRRFSMLSEKVKSFLGDDPINIVATMNAGYIDSSSWVHDLEIGGGRIIGEACHYIDFCSYIASSNIVSVCMSSMGGINSQKTDNATILLRYKNGTNAVINYFSNGNKSYPKEKIEIFNQQRTFIIDNWKQLNTYGVKGFSNLKIRQDKGHNKQFKLFAESIKFGKPIIPFSEIVNTTKASFAAIQSLKENKWVDVI